MKEVTITQINPEELGSLIEGVLRKILDSNEVKESFVDSAPMTIEQTAAFLNLTVSTLYDKVHRRTIPFMKEGKRLYFAKSELNDWLKQSRRKTTAEIESEAPSNLKKKGSKQ